MLNVIIMSRGLKELDDLEAVFSALAHAARRHVLRVVLNARWQTVASPPASSRPVSSTAGRRPAGICACCWTPVWSRWSARGREWIYVLNGERLKNVRRRLAGLVRTEGGKTCRNRPSSSHCSRPHAGKHAMLAWSLVQRHCPTLRKYELITDREPVICRAGDGTIIEVFEWVSDEAHKRVHELPEIAAIWEQMGACCAT